MELRHLRLLTALDRHGSLKHAAAALHLTPSALSHQLRQLEDGLGAKVLHRGAPQLTFTPLGREVLEAARDVLETVRGVKERAARAREQAADAYVHGYSRAEANRLYDQASSLTDFLHWDSVWDDGTLVLEAGCGVGAQTKIIAGKNPDTRFLAVDLSEKSLAQARKLATENGLTNVEFTRADLYDLPLADGSCDHVFVCFVLEHLTEPRRVLRELARVLRPGGTITVIEGDHGSTYFHPASEAARRAFFAQVELQHRKGGNANLGRQLYPLLQEVGYKDIRVSPRQIYVDGSKP
ncbi:MAG: methyltransferase domain-containing protein, partial [Bacteroidota bacterium]